MDECSIDQSVTLGGKQMMRSGAESIRHVDRTGCASGRQTNAWLVSLVMVATAMMIASVTKAAVARELACPSGQHLSRVRHHNMCIHTAMIRKGQRSAAIARPYDFPNSYVLHGPRF
jgi:hypothetical protein